MNNSILKIYTAQGIKEAVIPTLSTGLGPARLNVDNTFPPFCYIFQ